MCFPQLDAKQQASLQKETMIQTSMGMFETARLWGQPLDVVMQLIKNKHNEHLIDEAQSEGKGVILAVPHSGAWEIMNSWAAKRGNSNVLYRPPRQAWVEPAIVEGRKAEGFGLFRADNTAVRKIIRALKKNQVVGILPDQQPKLGDGIFSPFFGIPALTMTLLPRLLNKTNSVIIFAMVIRLPASQGFDVYFYPGDKDIYSTDTVKAVEAMNLQVEKLVREQPEQYQWVYKRFGRRPEGEQKFY